MGGTTPSTSGTPSNGAAPSSYSLAFPRLPKRDLRLTFAAPRRPMVAVNRDHTAGGANDQTRVHLQGRVALARRRLPGNGRARAVYARPFLRAARPPLAQCV